MSDREDRRGQEPAAAGVGESPDLSHEARTRRARHIQQMTAHIFGGFKQTRELPDGFALGYPNNRVWAVRLAEFSTDARRRLPALNTEVIDHSDGRDLWLYVRGPDGAKEYVRSQIALKPRLERSPMMRKLWWRYRRLTSRIRMMPDFIIIGVARGGTTSLYSYLAQHPSIAPAISKEISFFDLNFSPVIGRYRSYFPTRFAGQSAKRFRGSRLITGEASPTYMFFEAAPKRMFAALPEVKLIASLRSPVSRAYSHYNLAVRFGHESLSFEDAVEREIRGLCDWEFVRYLQWGIYADQLERWLDVFPREQLQIVTLEEFIKNRSKSFRRVLDFLDVPPWEPDRFEKFHSLPTVKMNDTTRARLVEYFRPHNERLYELLGTDFGWER